MNDYSLQGSVRPDITLSGPFMGGVFWKNVVPWDLDF